MTMYVYDTLDDVSVKVVTVINHTVPYLPDNVNQSLLVEELPDRTFREAWTLGSGSLALNYDTIRAIIRKERNNSLQLLDIKALAAERAGHTDTLSAINAQAQELRDIPSNEGFSLNDVNKLKELYILSRSVGQ